MVHCFSPISAQVGVSKPAGAFGCVGVSGTGTLRVPGTRYVIGDTQWLPEQEVIVVLPLAMKMTLLQISGLVLGLGIAWFVGPTDHPRLHSTRTH